MTDNNLDALNAVLRRIGETPRDRRFSHLAQLRKALGAYRAAGEAPPANALTVLRELEEDAVESLFDNMPV